MVLYSADPEADRAFFRDVLGFPFADAGHNWLIFALPPSELAVHPALENGQHEIYLLCDNLEATVAGLAARGVACSEPSSQRWGLLTQITLPGGGKLGLYEPRHAQPARG